MKSLHGNGIVFALSLAVVGAFAGLIPLAVWHDEYFTLYQFHAQGLPYLGERLLHWSPRPFSELIAYLYSLAVYRFHAPLLIWVLLPCWLLLGVALLLPVWRNTQGRVVTATLWAMLLLGAPTAELFYWPISAMAYLPTLAAAAVLLCVDLGDVSERMARLWRWIALLVAATSTEVGAMFALIYAALSLLTADRGSLRSSAMLLLPLLVAAAVLVVQFTGRVTQANEVFGDPTVAHHPAAVLSNLRENLWYQLAKGHFGHRKRQALVYGVLLKLLFATGIYLLLSVSPRTPEYPRQQRRLVLAIALLASATLTLAASLYNFGSACCERHDALRQGYVFIALASLAAYLASRWPARRTAWAPGALLVALALALSSAQNMLRHDYAHYAEILRSRQANWQFGMASGSVLQVETARSHIAGEPLIAPGDYPANASAPTELRWMLQFFDKSSAVVTPMEEHGADAS